MDYVALAKDVLSCEQNYTEDSGTTTGNQLNVLLGQVFVAHFSLYLRFSCNPRDDDVGYNENGNESNDHNSSRLGGTYFCLLTRCNLFFTMQRDPLKRC